MPQIAKVMGARVVAVCRGSAKADALRKLGADAVVDTAEAGKDVPLRQLIKAWPIVLIYSIQEVELRVKEALHHGLVGTVEAGKDFPLAAHQGAASYPVQGQEVMLRVL